MGSNYFGEPNLRNERYRGGGSSSSSSSSSRKGKKKNNNGNNSEKPKQPQRGLGVAQLEKIRLDSQMALAAAYNINSDYSINPLYFPNPQEDVRLQRPCISTSSSPSPLSFYTSTQLPSSVTSYGFDAPQTIKMMSKGEPERTYVSYSQPSLNTRWNAGKTIPGIQHSQQSQLTTRQLLDLEAEEATGKNKKARCDSVGSGSAVSGSSNSEELDLELRLSL